MSRAGLTGLCLLLAVGGLSNAPDAQACGGRSLFGASVSTCEKALNWRYDEGARAFVKSGVVDPRRTSGDRFEYELNERCDPGSDCAAAALPCADREGLPGRMFQAWAFRVGAGGVREPTVAWIGNVCVYPGRSVPLSAVQAAVHEELRKRIPSPSVTSAPPGVSLVNLLTIFSTTPAPEQAIAFAQPVPGEVRAVPEYAWDFGDGIHGVGPGRPFTSSVLPSKNPEYYTGAKYTQPGTKHVTLTVTWRVTFRLEGVQDIPLQPIVMTASEDKQIATARAVLVN